MDTISQFIISNQSYFAKKNQQQSNQSGVLSWFYGRGEIPMHIKNLSC